MNGVILRVTSRQRRPRRSGLARGSTPKCFWATEVRSTPQDLPSTGTPPAGLALCAMPPMTLWVSQGAPQTTHPVPPSRV